MWNPFKRKKNIIPLLCSFSVTIGHFSYKADGPNLEACSEEIKKFHRSIKTAPVDYIG